MLSDPSLCPYLLNLKTGKEKSKHIMMAHSRVESSRGTGFRVYGGSHKWVAVEHNTHTHTHSQLMLPQLPVELGGLCNNWGPCKACKTYSLSLSLSLSKAANTVSAAQKRYSRAKYCRVAIKWGGNSERLSQNYGPP